MFFIFLLYKRLNNYLNFSQSHSNFCSKWKTDDAQSVNDALIGGLSYKLKPGASYATNRRSVSYLAQGGNRYSPNGVKVVNIDLTGDQWLDPSTFRVVFQLNHAGNVGAPEGSPIKLIEPLSWNPAVCFRRARIICGGVVVGDIDILNRLSLMLTARNTEEEQNVIAGESFCNYDFKGYSSHSRATYRLEDYDMAGTIIESRRVLFKICLDFSTKVSCLLFAIVLFRLSLNWLVVFMTLS